ncbi:MAG: hypothetical protein M1528_02270 [Candidatus Marsarchaeota archaeon]|nr:hypothetical protein [Candidatus Marsarchaeota archaeon]
MVSNNEIVSIALSAITVVLFIIAVIVFINYGGSSLFYVIIVIAFVVGLLNAWLISKHELPRSSQQSSAATREARQPRKIARAGNKRRARR